MKVCKGISGEEESQSYSVTKDLVLRIKAQILGIEAQDFSTEQVIAEEGQYSGRQQLLCGGGQVQRIQEKRRSSVKELIFVAVGQDGK